MDTPKTTLNNSHVSQSTKLFSSLNLKGDNIIQLQRLWDAIIPDLCQYPSTNNIRPKKL